MYNPRFTLRNTMLKRCNPYLLMMTSDDKVSHNQLSGWIQYGITHSSTDGLYVTVLPFSRPMGVQVGWCPGGCLNMLSAA